MLLFLGFNTSARYATIIGKKKILLILGEIWSKGSNLTSLLLVDVFAVVAQVNAEALNIKPYQPWQKRCQGSAEAKCFVM